MIFAQKLYSVVIRNKLNTQGNVFWESICSSLLGGLSELCRSSQRKLYGPSCTLHFHHVCSMPGAAMGWQEFGAGKPQPWRNMSIAFGAERSWHPQLASLASYTTWPPFPPSCEVSLLPILGVVITQPAPKASTWITLIAGTFLIVTEERINKIP